MMTTSSNDEIIRKLVILYNRMDIFAERLGCSEIEGLERQDVRYKMIGLHNTIKIMESDNFVKLYDTMKIANGWWKAYQ